MRKNVKLRLDSGGAMSKKLFFSLFIACLISIIVSNNAQALTKGFEASSFHPAVDDGPYFTVYGTETLARWQWVGGTMAHYAYRPFQLTQNGARVRGIIDDALLQEFYASMGLVDRWLQVGLDVPVGWWLAYTDPSVATATEQNKIAMGDVQINLKSEFLQLQKHKVGLGLLPFITIPTGSGKYFNGAGGVTGGGKLLLEFLPFSRWHIALNAGVLFRQKFTILNIEQYHQLLYGLGTAVDVTKHVSVAAEMTGRAKLSDLFGSKEESPLEADVGMEYKVGDSGFKVSGGGGAGLIRGSGAPTFRVFAGMSYRSKSKQTEEGPDPLDVVRSAVIHFTYDGREFASLDDAQRLIDVAEVLKAHTSARVKVLGYTDDVGTTKYNMKLSQKRADQIRDYLENRGISPLRLSAEGMGEADPVADNATPEGRAENRRVEFKVY
jgi:outer membrane protein OmpA-like peptidoglycan-associated protein